MVLGRNLVLLFVLEARGSPFAESSLQRMSVVAYQGSHETPLASCAKGRVPIHFGMSTKKVIFSGPLHVLKDGAVLADCES